MRHRRLGFLLLLAGCLLLAIPLAALSGLAQMVDANGQYYFQDFINYWAAPRIALDQPATLFSEDRYAQALDAFHGSALPRHHWSYPLHALLFLLPLTALPLAAAAALWSVAGLALYSFTLVRLMPHARPWALALGLLSSASLVNLWASQNGYFTASLFLLALLWLQTRPRIAGLLLGILTIKPHLGLVWPVLLIRQRRWSTIAMAVASCAVLVGVTFLWLGGAAWGHYFTHTIPTQHALIHQTPFGRLFEAMMPSLPLTLQLWGISLELAFLAQAALSVAVLGALAWRLGRPMERAMQFLLLASAAMLATPYVFNYDMTLLSAALVMVLIDQPPSHWAGRLVLALGYLAPALVYWCYYFFPVAPFFILAVFLFALLARPATTAAA